MDRQHILYLVNKALEWQFEMYSFDNMIDDIEDLSNEEKKWAKENISYQAHIAERAKEG